MRHPFLRTLAGATGAAPTDPHFKNVTLLLHGDGTNGGQNNTFLDSSSNNFTITRNGNTTQGTFSPYGDNWSNYFGNSNTSLVANGTSSSGNFPTGTDFTIEFWWRSSAVNSGTGVVIGKTRFDSTTADSWWVDISGLNKLGFIGHNGTSTFTAVTSTTSVMDGMWHHCAVSRAGTTYRVFVDGALEQTNTTSTTINQGSHNITFSGITTNLVSNYGASGYISNLRIVKGTCLYTSSFTPSTAPLTAVTNTILLTCQSNRFKDNGPNAYTISTQQGNPSVQRFSPFSPTAAYAAGTIGGSGYFDGDGDYLSSATNTAFNPGTGNFTIEAWFYLTANSAQNGNGTRFAQIAATLASGNGLEFNIAGNASTTGTGFEFINTVSGTQYKIAATTTVTQNAWHHVAAVRSGTTTTIYFNGVSVASGTLGNQNISSSGDLWIGSLNVTNYRHFLIGYISDFRFVKGTAVYTATFTPPTAPIGSITNTSLLLNFQNAAILDNAMMNDVETIADAQIDTAQKKFGTGSLEFDGTSDNLSFKSNNELALGNADFTVELWFYARTASTHRLFSLYASGSGASYYAGIRIDLNGGPGAFGLWSSDGANHNIGTYQGSWSQNTWTHLAITRNNNTFRFFKNGTQFYTVNSGHWVMTGNYSTIGMLAGYGGDWFNGFIDDFRVTKGIARYTANFTPPTAALPDL